MQWALLALAIAATVGYHLVLKVTPASVNPVLSLTATYALVTVVFLVIYLLTPATAPLRASMQQINWAGIALCVAGLWLIFRK